MQLMEQGNILCCRAEFGLRHGCVDPNSTRNAKRRTPFQPQGVALFFPQDTTPSRKPGGITHRGETATQLGGSSVSFGPGHWDRIVRQLSQEVVMTPRFRATSPCSSRVALFELAHLFFRYSKFSSATIETDNNLGKYPHYWLVKII